MKILKHIIFALSLMACANVSAQKPKTNNAIAKRSPKVVTSGARDAGKVVTDVQQNLKTLIENYRFTEAYNQLQGTINQRRNKKQQTSELLREKNIAEMGSRMLGATQKVVFIDSIVVARDKFLSTIRLSNDAGRLYTYNEFFDTDSMPGCYLHLNALGDKCYFAKVDSDNNMQLFSSYKMDDKWSAPTLMPGLADARQEFNYPFMMGDSNTFYFAAQGSKSLGGYDIFVTRFDEETGKFLRPENIGMPFNSLANDYMYCEDEVNNIGWFVTDRGQEVNNVCIYMFIPNEDRDTYSPTDNSEDDIVSRARISSIADTWGDGKSKDDALDRLKRFIEESETKKNNDDFVFPINDRTVYHSMTDFKSSLSRDKMKTLMAKKREYAKSTNYLDKIRDLYAKSDKNRRIALKSDILQLESNEAKMISDIHTLEKSIRNLENK
jgi:hypothetical protein